MGEVGSLPIVIRCPCDVCKAGERLAHQVGHLPFLCRIVCAMDETECLVEGALCVESHLGCIGASIVKQNDMVAFVVGMLFVGGQRFLHQAQSLVGVALRQCFGQPLIRDIIGVPILSRFRQLYGFSQQGFSLAGAVVGQSSHGFLQTTFCCLRISSPLLAPAASRQQNANDEYVPCSCLHCFQFLIVSRLQRYNVIFNVVSFAYGKYVNVAKMETANNQRIMKNCARHPMENFCQ